MVPLPLQKLRERNGLQAVLYRMQMKHIVEPFLTVCKQTLKGLSPCFLAPQLWKLGMKGLDEKKPYP